MNRAKTEYKYWWQLTDEQQKFVKSCYPANTDHSHYQYEIYNGRTVVDRYWLTDSELAEGKAVVAK